MKHFSLRTAVVGLSLLVPFLFGNIATAQSRFKVPLQIHSGTTTITIEFGVYGDGPGGSIVDNTLGFDGPPFVTVADLAFEDLVAPPAPPAPFDLHARFLTPPGYTTTIPVGLGSTGALRDIRGFSNTSQIDTFLVRLSGEDASGLFGAVTMTWPATLTTYAAAWTMKPRTGSDFAQLSMTGQTSLNFTPSSNQIDILVIKSGAALVGVNESESALPQAYALQQNFPNPFNPTTQITFNLPEQAFAQLTVFDMLGRPVQQLASGMFEAGSHQLQFDASKLTSGIYFYRLQTPTVSLTRRMTLLK